MKGHKIRFLSVIATFMLISSILSSQALAVARSSKYLDAYGTYVSPVGNGKIVITIVLRFALRKYIEEFIGYRRLHNGDIYLPPISHQQGYRHMMSIPLLTLIYAALC